MKTECPSCKHAYEVEGVAVVPKSQVLTMKLGYESEFICAESLGKAILNMEIIQRQVAKKIGVKVVVFVRSIITKPKELSVEFQIIRSE